MLDCAGTAAVHDLQMSQLRRHQFIELSEPIPVFYYDWSGKIPLEKRRVVKQQFKAVDPGRAHVVFMWWELNMDTEGQYNNIRVFYGFGISSSLAWMDVTYIYF